MKVSPGFSLAILVLLCLTSFGYVTPTVFAATGGSATSCASLAICNYSIGGGSGSASTDAAVSGYVGQNFSFSGGSLDFRLPGETHVSNDTGVYAGEAINTNVFSTTAGLVYRVTGTFSAADYNTGKIVKGQTLGYVGIKGHSGRGGGIYFTMLNGTISFKVTNQFATVTEVACNPASLTFGASTKCTAIVTDLSGIASVPTGKVTFSSTLGFSPIRCTLSGGSCTVTIRPAAGTWPVYASYTGDSLHYKSSTQGPELYVSCPAGGC